MTLDDVVVLRHYVDEQDTTAYGDQFLEDVIGRSSGDLNLAASEIWSMKAARYAQMVDVAEAGASRRMGQLHEHAVKQAEVYRGRSTAAAAAAGAFTVTRPIERP